MLEGSDSETGEMVLMAHRILIRISHVRDRVIFRICLDYWVFLTKSLYILKSEITNPILLGRLDEMQSCPPRLRVYKPILSDLLHVMIRKMARPKEVLVFRDEDGNVHKQESKDTDAYILYVSMRECLVYLVHIDPIDARKIMLIKLKSELDGNTDSLNKNELDRLCYAIGSVSGAMDVDFEREFLVAVIKDLLQLCDHKHAKVHKAVVAANIMYVVGQYPRFLRQH